MRQRRRREARGVREEEGSGKRQGVGGAARRGGEECGMARGSWLGACVEEGGCEEGGGRMREEGMEGEWGVGRRRVLG